MVERLNPLDASFLYLEEPATPMHVGGLLVLDAPPGGLDALAALVEARLPLVPRYRQRVAEVAPGSPLRAGLRSMAAVLAQVPEPVSPRRGLRRIRRAG